VIAPGLALAYSYKNAYARIVFQCLLSLLVTSGLGEAGQKMDSGYRNGTYPIELNFENNIIKHNKSFSGATHKVMMYNNSDPSSKRRDPAEYTYSTITVSGSECHGNAKDNIVGTLTN
jgi:hypothetical protein